MPDRTCNTPGCSRPSRSRGVCNLHYMRARNDTDGEITYSAIHVLLNQQRGLARRHDCVDCGEPARDWSYDQADPDQITTATGAHFSPDLDHYQPRCKSCHIKQDRQHRNAELQALAQSIELDIRHAITEQKAARKRNDLVALDFWDGELERLTAPLRAQTGPLAIA